MALQKKLLFATVVIIGCHFLATVNVNVKALTIWNRCYSRADSGPCYAHMTRYYYNAWTRRCQTFIYGGCKGNANNYLTLKSCQDRCEPKKKDICQLPKVVGPCRAAIPRFYYNSKSGKCESFTYGGCHGNANNFYTRKRCNMACLGYHVAYLGRARKDY